MQLLTLLLENAGETVSKQDILDTVWDDVVVDDQVIFQSIKELRKVFADAQVIKTVPRKGYSWLLPVQQATECAQKPADTPDANKSSRGRLAVICVAFIIIITGFAGALLNKGDETTISGSLIVLPVNNQIRDADHKWVRYGAMDQLIQRLHSTDTAGVLQTDYVFDVMARARMPLSDFSKKHIEQVFKVSGASLVVETTLAGLPKDYQLLYSLYYRDRVEKGTVTNQQVSLAFDQLAGIIGNRLDKNFALPSSAYASSLANELLSHALELKQQGDFKQAIELLNAAIITNPSAVMERRILGQLLVEQRYPFEQAFETLQQGIEQAKTTNNQKELLRLNFWQGMNHVSHGDLPAAEAFFEPAREGATLTKDWLYLAYLQEVKGQVFQFQGQFELAEASYYKAMEYHQVLQCPLGYSNGLMNLSQLSYAQNQHQQAIDFAQQTLDVVSQRELLDKKPQVEKWLSQLSADKPETNPH